MIYGVFLIYIAIRMLVKFSDENQKNKVSYISRKKLIFWGGSIGFVASLLGSRIDDPFFSFPLALN